MAEYAPLQIVIPIYNDWESVRRLLPLVDEQLAKSGLTADALLANDGSSIAPPQPWEAQLTSVRSVRILNLRRNVGHQRAICVALCHLLNASNCQRVLVMDGDGEDAPADIPRLIEKLESDCRLRIVFAERTKRSEGILFTVFYTLYRLLHRLLVGHRVRVGNFSVMKRECLESLCATSDLWNHYAAAVFASRQPMAMVPTHRATRLAGHSSMNFPALVMHGLSALSVFADKISTRLLILSAIATVLTIVGMVVVTLIRLAGSSAIPGWATNAFGILLLLLVQVGTFIFTFCFLILFTRALSPFIPLRDYQHFVSRVEEVWHGHDS
jgi:hypothetical protein